MCRSTYLFINWIMFVLSVNSYRLPTSITPSHYKLQILSHLGAQEPENFDYEGQVWIQVNCHELTQNITLHSQDLNITDGLVTVKGLTSATQKPLHIESVKKDLLNDFLIIHLSQPLEKDHKYEVSISFKAELVDGLKGFYKSSYTDEKTKEKRWLGVTQFEAISARKAFPCFDEPAMKAVFEISIGRKTNYTSISNMPIIQTEPVKEKEGWVWDHYAPSVPMSTYLVAFIVSDFGFKVSEPSQHNNVTFRIWAKKDSLDQVEYARKVGPKALEYYEKFFNISYPLPKQDMIAIPDFSAGAMENWGLITYREALLLFDAKISSLTNQHRIVSVIAHELAHQWFGNLVTMKWWTDLWLNEGFATYMASRVVEDLYPHWKSLMEEAVSNILTVFAFDSLRTSHPVSVPIGHPNEIDEIFDTISYKKGSFLIRMMSLFLGDETLRHGVSSYLRAHKYKNAEQDDLWQSLTEEAHKNNALPKNLTVKTVMDTWTLQTGYPLVTVTRDYTKKSAILTQHRFLKDAVKEKSDGGCWWVPISYTNGEEKQFDSAAPKLWLNCSEGTSSIDNLPENTWILLNIKLGGLYKINYDEKNWHLLSATLNSESHEQIPILNKVQLLDDAYDLAWTAKLKYEILFDLLKYLRFEKEYLPWKSALSNVNSLNRQVKKSAVYGDLKVYMRSLLISIYEQIGGLNYFEKDDSDQLETIQHKILINNWACRFDVANCISDAQELFKKFMKNPQDKQIISKEMRSVIYCTAIRNGGEKEWDFLWTQYKKSTVASEKNTILNALGCTREIWLQRRYLEWSITPNSGIRKQDSSSVFAAVASNDVGFYIARDFLNTHIKEIYKYLSQNARRLSRYLSSVASQTTSEDDYQELQDFVNVNSMYLKEVKQGVQQSLETAKLNVQWQNKHFNEVGRLLRKHADEERKRV